MKENLSPEFDDALAFAARLHRDQFRKGTSIPYISHLMSVSSLILEFGGTEAEAIAGLLHDAIEDQGGDRIRKVIQRRFGEEVTAIVDACTDAEITPKPPWRERKEAYIAHLRTAPDSVRLVSGCDKLHNARAILLDYRKHGEELWSRFNGGKDGTLWYYRSIADILLKQGQEQLAAELDRVVTEIERLASAKKTKVRDIAIGHGSKWHLIRNLGWHREEFDRLVKRCVPGLSEVKWLDQHFTGKAGKTEEQDAELQGLEFLRPQPEAWSAYWPQTGRRPTWDAIGDATINGTKEWLLVEAKAHIDELASSTVASEDSQAIIQRAMEETQQAMGVDPGYDWLKGYYQYANRLAVLHFLRREGIPARLLFIYFWGDRPGEGSNWPQTENEWEPPLREMEMDLGLEGDHQYSDFIHKLFLPVTGESDGGP